CTPPGAAGRRPPTCSTPARSTGCADAAECRAMTALESLDLPNPEFTPAQAIALVREHWGIEAEVSEVGSTQDQNFRATVADGRRYVLKIASPGWRRAELECQNAAMEHLAAGDPGFAVPVPV